MLKKGKKKSNLPLICGIIIPAQWDEDGNVIGVTIHTNDEKVYIVEHTKTGEELLNHINQKVEARGRVRERVDGSMLISVASYFSIENYEGTNRLSLMEANSSTESRP